VSENIEARSIACVKYASKSSPDEKDSTGSQSEAVQARIAQIGGREIVAGFAEEDATGYKGNRGRALVEAIAAVTAAADERGEAELWVWHSSRLARGSGKKNEARALGKLFWDLLERGVTIRSVQDDEFVTNASLIGIASTQNYKYSDDLAANVARAKRAQFDRGERLGGPIPDGYLQQIKRDARDNVTERAYLLDPEREAVIARLFELVLAGVPDATIARRMNGEGYRTRGYVMQRDSAKTARKAGDVVAGKPWTRRRVQDTVTNPWYAGRIARNRSTAGAPVEWRDADHPRYIERDDFDRSIVARGARDLGAGSDRRPKGRPNSNHLLAGLAVCADCGERMKPVTGTYRRKSDGGRARSYMCSHVAHGTDLCHAPSIDAETIEPRVINHLERYFIDFDGWLAALTEQHSQLREQLARNVDAEREKIAAMDRRAALMRERYARHAESGEDVLAAADAMALQGASEQREQAVHRLTQAEAMLADADIDSAPADTMLDAYNEIAAEVRGALKRGRLQDINEGLRARFDRFLLKTGPEGVLVLPILHGTPTQSAAGRTLDMWERRELAGTGFVASGRSEIVPPTVPLTVPSAEGPNAHE